MDGNPNRGVQDIAAIVESHEVIEQRGVVGEIEGRGNGERGVVESSDAGALDEEGVEDAARIGEEARAEREFPTEEIAIVARIAVENLDIPFAVQGATDKAREALVGMVEIGAGGDIRGIDLIPVSMTLPINDAVARGILIAGADFVAPTIVPANTGSIARDIGITGV